MNNLRGQRVEPGEVLIHKSVGAVTVMKDDNDAYCYCVVGKDHKETIQDKDILPLAKVNLRR